MAVGYFIFHIHAAYTERHRKTHNLKCIFWFRTLQFYPMIIPYLNYNQIDFYTRVEFIYVKYSVPAWLKRTILKSRYPNAIWWAHYRALKPNLSSTFFNPCHRSDLNVLKKVDDNQSKCIPGKYYVSLRKALKLNDTEKWLSVQL